MTIYNMWADGENDRLAAVSTSEGAGRTEAQTTHWSCYWVHETYRIKTFSLYLSQKPVIDSWTVWCRSVLDLICIIVQMLWNYKDMFGDSRSSH